MRVTDGFRYQLFTNNLSTLKEKIDRTNTMIASGKKVLLPSDDPTGFAKNIEITSQQSANSQYNKNISQLKTLGTYYETSVNTISDLLTEAKQLAVQMASDTADVTSRKSAADEVDGIIQQLAAIGNTKIGSSYIFGGKKSDVAPYALDAVTGTYAYRTGSTDVSKVSVDSATTVDAGISGDRVFGNGLPGGGLSIFQTLKQFSDDLRNNDTTGIGTDLNNIGTCIDQTADNLSYVGTYTKQLDTLLATNQTRDATLAGTSSDLMDADTAALIADYNNLSLAYQSALYTMSKVQSLSILNYLR